MSRNLSLDEMIFARRMLPHFISGKTPEQSAASVLEDDLRIFNAICDRKFFYYVAIGDGKSASTREGPGDVIVSEITESVYQILRQVRPK
jgi:hypothetical protein